MPENNTSFKSPKKGSNILCRVSNPTPEMVCRYVKRLPKNEMSESQFRSIMGSSWFANEHQAPEQWGLYYIDGVTYHPRFSRDITEKEARRYLNGWMKRLIVINPYTKFKVVNDNGLVKSIVQQLESNPDVHDLKTIMKEIIGVNENFIVNDILANTLNYYSGVLTVTTVDKDNELFNVSLKPNYKDTLNNDNMTKEQYFHLFDGIVMDYVPDVSLQKIYYGCPGTGKSHKVKGLTEGKDNEKVVYFDQSGNLIEDISTIADRTKVTTNIFRTTFHPDYDYSSFVGSYKPVMVQVQDGNGNDTDKEDLIYDFVPQVFTNAYVRAWKSLADESLTDAEKQVYLIIEEINRGNCAQIFGDLFQLLDRKNGYSEYPIIPDAELRKYLAKQELESNRLKLPCNLHILATMNTSDQSLFPMDSAFKRRWAMEYVPINLDGKNSDGTDSDAKNYTFTVKGVEYAWLDFLKKVNPLIRKATDSEDKQMGEFFIKENISEEDFKNKVMFYIWNDVCKDLYSASRLAPQFFMRDNEGEGRENAFTFAELYGAGRFNEEENSYTEPSDLLEGFITKYLKLKKIEATPDPNPEQQQAPEE